MFRTQIGKLKLMPLISNFRKILVQRKSYKGLHKKPLVRYPIFWLHHIPVFLGCWFSPVFFRVKSIWSKIHPEIELVITEAQLWKAMVKLRCRQLEIPENSALVDLRGDFFLYRKMAT